MNFAIFDNRRTRQILTIVFLAGVLLTIFPPEQPGFKWWAKQAAIEAPAYLLLGIFFLIINRTRLMFVCIGCSAAICFFKVEMRKGGIPNELPPVIAAPKGAPKDSL